MVRNSVKFVTRKDIKNVCKNLRTVYSSVNEESGLNALEDFGDKWQSKYPMIYKSWKKEWQNLVEFFRFPEGIRNVIYTTNAIESLNYSLRKVIRNKSSFPDDDSIYKVMYLAVKNACERWTMPIKNWIIAKNQFAILFEGRVPLK